MNETNFGKMNNLQSKTYDDLNLSAISVSEVPNDILFPEELNQYLRGQIQFLTHANGMLQKTLSEKELMIENNLKTIFEYENSASKLTTTDNPAYLLTQKVVELSKKVKNKNAEIESLKAKYSTVQQKLKLLESEKIKDEIRNKVSYRDANEIKMLQDKLTVTTNKLLDSKNTNIQLKNELKAANKILQQEIGDCFTSIQNLTNSQTNWRGRAQQILTLRQKNAELQEKLISENYKDPAANTNKNDNRKQIIEQLQKEVNDVKQELDETRKKLTGSRARTKIFENECATLKCKINSLTEKNNSDNDIIQMLSSRISRMEEAQNDIKKEKENCLKKIETENRNANIELDKQKYIQENLKKCLADKDNKISALEYELTKARLSVASNQPCTPSSDDECREKNEEDKTVQTLNCEILKLTRFISTLNERLDGERNAHSITRDNYHEALQKAAQLEHRLARLEIENSIYSSQSYNRAYSKLNAAEMAKPSNLDIENLQNRLEIAEEHLANLRTKVAILKKEKELDYKQFVCFIEEFSCLLGQKESTNK